MFRQMSYSERAYLDLLNEQGIHKNLNLYELNRTQRIITSFEFLF